MRRRHGFTLVEMLVATALVLFVMVILTEAFVAGLDTFSKLKAIGDMEERLRTATTLLRRDLVADHFEGRRRLSDSGFWIQGTPREGFFRIVQGPVVSPFQDEGFDGDAIASRRRTTHALHFSVKLRGNRRENFFSARVPTAWALLGNSSTPIRTNFFDQPPDARYEDTPGSYNSQWAEVAYWLVRTGTTLSPTDATSPETAGGPKPVFALYRSQFVVVSDNSTLNWPQLKITATTLAAYDQYGEISCKKSNPTAAQFPDGLYFNNPSDLADPARRVFPDALSPLRGAALLLTDVLSFDVQVLPSTNGQPAAAFVDLPTGGPPLAIFDTSVAPTPTPYSLAAVQITVRLWDAKSQQARQITLMQDL